MLKPIRVLIDLHFLFFKNYLIKKPPDHFSFNRKFLKSQKGQEYTRGQRVIM